MRFLWAILGTLLSAALFIGGLFYTVFGFLVMWSGTSEGAPSILFLWGLACIGGLFWLVCGYQLLVKKVLPLWKRAL